MKLVILLWVLFLLLALNVLVCAGWLLFMLDSQSLYLLGLSIDNALRAYKQLQMLQLQLKLGFMTLVRQCCLLPLDYHSRFEVRYVSDFNLSASGIGAGVESMSVAPLAFEGSVNPKVGINKS